MATSLSSLKFRTTTTRLHKSAKKEEKPKRDSGSFGTFQLAGCTWEIRTSPDINDYGYTANATHTVMLRDDLTTQSTDITLWHEALHAMLFTMGKSDNHDEEFVDALAHLLMQFSGSLRIHDAEAK